MLEKLRNLRKLFLIKSKAIFRKLNYFSKNKMKTYKETHPIKTTRLSKLTVVRLLSKIKLSAILLEHLLKKIIYLIRKSPLVRMLFVSRI